MAATFLIFLLAEWGSHSVIEANPLPADAPSISANDVPHDDPCDTLMLCSDRGRNDQQRSNLGREATQHSAPLDLLAVLCHRICARGASRIEFSTANVLSRYISPPFHPPELS
ncbi:MAG: hypothetical protein WBD27_04200 [Pyrinomonadaceae bacterium]